MTIKWFFPIFPKSLESSAILQLLSQRLMFQSGTPFAGNNLFWKTFFTNSSNVIFKFKCNWILTWKSFIKPLNWSRLSNLSLKKEAKVAWWFVFLILRKSIPFLTTYEKCTKIISTSKSCLSYSNLVIQQVRSLPKIAKCIRYLIWSRLTL